MVLQSKSFVSDDDVSSCMLCCLVHVSTRKATCTRTNLMKTLKISFLLFKFNFSCFSKFTPLLLIPFHPHISVRTSKTSPTFLLPAEIFIIFTSPKSSSSLARNVAKDSVLTKDFVVS